MSARHATVISAATLMLLGTAVSAQADSLPQNPIVVCANAANQIDADFASGEATVNSTVWHDCVSVSIPAIVRGIVEPTNANASGAPVNAVITAPQWKISWYNSADQKIAESTGSLTYTYLGPLANVMAAVIVDGNLNEVGAGTASRVCATPDQCTYDNMQILVKML